MESALASWEWGASLWSQQPQATESTQAGGDTHSHPGGPAEPSPSRDKAQSSGWVSGASSLAPALPLAHLTTLDMSASQILGLFI